MSNGFTLWANWRLNLLFWNLRRIFRFNSIARREVNHIYPQDPQDGKLGYTPFEDTLHTSFYRFENAGVDPHTFAKLDFAIVLLAAGLLTLYLVPQFALAAFSLRFAYLGAGLAILAAIILLVQEMFFSSHSRERVTAKDYEAAKALLEDFGERSRRPMPAWMWLLIVLMLLVDAAMISIVAIDYVADLPRKYAMLGGIGIGFVVAAMLAFLTHAAGKSLYRGTKRRELEPKMQRLGEEVQKLSSDTDPAAKEELASTKRTYDILERFTIKHAFLSPERYLWLMLTIMVVGILAVAAFGARYSTQADIILSQFESAQQSLGLEINNDMLPAEVTQAQSEAGKDIAKEHEANARKGTLFALTVLTIVFIALQVVSIMLSYSHAFCCDETQAAYRQVKTFELKEGLSEESKSMVHKSANKLFAAYYDALINMAVAQKKVLQERHAMTMERIHQIKEDQKT